MAPYRGLVTLLLLRLLFQTMGFAIFWKWDLARGKGAQCTLLLHPPEFSTIPDKQFDLLFKLTAMQNRWISPNNKWGTK